MFLLKTKVWGNGGSFGEGGGKFGRISDSNKEVVDASVGENCARTDSKHFDNMDDSKIGGHPNKSAPDGGEEDKGSTMHPKYGKNSKEEETKVTHAISYYT